MKIPVYQSEDILNAISTEGLHKSAWGYKTPYCIWVFTDGMEKTEIWSQFPSPLTGYEVSSWNSHCIERVTYFLIDDYEGNLDRLNHQLENPSSKEVTLDDSDDYNYDVDDDNADCMYDPYINACR